jgi:hypothetical protein
VMTCANRTRARRGLDRPATTARSLRALSARHRHGPHCGRAPRPSAARDRSTRQHAASRPEFREFAR